MIEAAFIVWRHELRTIVRDKFEARAFEAPFVHCPSSIED
jgi:hypothetical protein